MNNSYSPYEEYESETLVCEDCGEVYTYFHHCLVDELIENDDNEYPRDKDDKDYSNYEYED